MKESQQEDSLETVNADERVDTIADIIDEENAGDKGDGDARKSQLIADEVQKSRFEVSALMEPLQESGTLQDRQSLEAISRMSQFIVDEDDDMLQLEDEIGTGDKASFMLQSQASHAEQVTSKLMEL